MNWHKKSKNELFSKLAVSWFLTLLLRSSLKRRALPGATEASATPVHKRLTDICCSLFFSGDLPNGSDPWPLPPALKQYKAHTRQKMTHTPQKKQRVGWRYPPRRRQFCLSPAEPLISCIKNVQRVEPPPLPLMKHNRVGRLSRNNMIVSCENYQLKTWKNF